MVVRGIFNAASVAFSEGGGTVRHKLITYSGGVTTITGSITVDNTGELSNTVYVGSGGTLKIGGAVFPLGMVLSQRPQDLLSNTIAAALRRFEIFHIVI